MRAGAMHPFLEFLLKLIAKFWSFVTRFFLDKHSPKSVSVCLMKAITII